MYIYSMIKRILIFIWRAVVIVCFFCACMLLTAFVEQEIKKSKKYKSYIGKQIVIDGDTTRIVEYSSGGYGNQEGFYLYNGAIVSPDIVEEFIVE